MKSNHYELTNAWAALAARHPELFSFTIQSDHIEERFDSLLEHWCTPKNSEFSDLEIERAREFVDRLAEPDHTVISLHAEGISQNKIAAMVGVSQKTISVRLRRIRQRFAEEPKTKDKKGV